MDTGLKIAAAVLLAVLGSVVWFGVAVGMGLW